MNVASPVSGSRLRGVVPRSLGERVLVASVLLALVVAVVFGLLLLAISSLHKATDRQTRSKDVTAATLSLEKVVLDLEAGLRGFVISGQPRLLAPWYRALPGFSRSRADLARLVADDAEESGQVREVARLVDAYERDYGTPLIAIARESPAAARSPLAIAEGQRRIALIRRRLTRLLDDGECARLGERRLGEAGDRTGAHSRRQRLGRLGGSHHALRPVPRPRGRGTGS